MFWACRSLGPMLPPKVPLLRSSLAGQIMINPDKAHALFAIEARSPPRVCAGRSLRCSQAEDSKFELSSSFVQDLRNVAAQEPLDFLGGSAGPFAPIPILG